MRRCWFLERRLSHADLTRAKCHIGPQHCSWIFGVKVVVTWSLGCLGFAVALCWGLERMDCITLPAHHPLCC